MSTYPLVRTAVIDPITGALLAAAPLAVLLAKAEPLRRLAGAAATGLVAKGRL